MLGTIVSTYGRGLSPHWKTFVIDCNEGTYYVNAYLDGNPNGMGTAIQFSGNGTGNAYSFECIGGADAVLKKLDNEIDMSSMEFLSLRGYDFTASKDYKYLFIYSGYHITYSGSLTFIILNAEKPYGSSGATANYSIAKDVAAGSQIHVSSSATSLGFTILGLP